MKTTLNVRYLLGLLVVLGVATVAIYFLHRRQAGKLVEAYLHQADAAEQHGEADRAADFLRRYLVMRPNDLEARVRLGLYEAKGARSSRQLARAFLTLEQVLRDAPDRADIRRKNVDLAMDPRLGYFQEAEGHLQVLLAAIRGKPDGELEDLRGQCLLALGKFPEARTAFERAIQAKPELVDSYARLAFVLRDKLNEPDRADEVIARLIDKHSPNASNGRACLVAAAYWREFGQEQQANDALARARQIAPDDPDVVLAVTERLRWRAEDLAAKQDTTGASAAREEAISLLRQAVDRSVAALTSDASEGDGAADLTARRGIVGRLFRTLTAAELAAGQLPQAEATARKGVENLSDDPEMALSLADVLVRRGNPDEADRQLDRLKDRGLSVPLVDYHRARVLIGRNQWHQASQTLERVVANHVGQPEGSRGLSHLLLGQCYEKLGQFDRQYEAFRKALPTNPLDPLRIPATVGMASALVGMGRIEDAIPLYEGIAVRAPSVYLALARLRYQEAIRQNPAKPDFTRTEEMLRHAPEGVDVDLVRAELLVGRGEADAARNLLLRSRDKHDKAIEPWVGLALIELRSKNPGKAADLLKQAEAKLGDGVEIRIARARMHLLEPTAKPAEQLARLAEGIDGFTQADRHRLLRSLANLADGVEPSDVAARLWDRIAREFPDDLSGHLARFDRAQRLDDEAGMAAAAGEITRLDGPDGQSTRAVRVMTALRKARQGDRSQYAEVSRILDSLERDRGGWSRVPFWQGMVLDLQGNLAAAVPLYRKAVEMGERNPEVIRRLVEFYYDRQQFADADAVLKRLPEGGAKTERLQMVATELALRGQDEVRALELAEKAVGGDTKDYRKLIWLGRIRYQTGKRAEAEEPIRQAIAEAGDRPEPWVALVQYLIAMDRKPDALKAVEEARARMKGEGADPALALCHELLGQPKQAQEIYTRLLNDRGRDARVLRNAAGFYWRTGDLKNAEATLQRLLVSPSKSPEDVAFARRLLPVALVAQGGVENSRRALEALQPLDRGDGANFGTVEDLRARAFTLAMQPDLKNKREAIRLIEEYGGRRPLEPADQFLLARLFNAIGDWPKARTRLASLTRTAEPNPIYITFYALGLIREPDLREAENWVEKIEQLRPDSLEAVELRVRLLVARGDRTQARELLTKMAATRKDVPVLQVALLLEQLGIGDAAEPFYKRFVTESKKPEATLDLAKYYARQNRLTEALALCEQAWKTCRPELVAKACVAVLYTARKPGSTQIRRVVGWVDEARLRNPESTALVSSLGNLQNLLADYDATIGMYQKAIARNPKDALAMNNLAFFLALKEGRHDEALQLLERAKAVAGPSTTLLDTEAMVHIAKGNPQKAITLMNEVVVRKPSGVAFFHLAQAQLAANKQVDARLAWQQVKKYELTLGDLHPLERKGYEAVATALDGTD